jgi:DUF438 domain-containing protein
MLTDQTLKCILDSIPYSIVFVDTEHIVRFLNRCAKYRYYQERGYSELIGKSIFDCHNEKSVGAIKEAFERFKNHGQEEFLKVSVRNERIYITPVRDDNGNLLGYSERFEANFTRADTW